MSRKKPEITRIKATSGHLKKQKNLFKICLHLLYTYDIIIKLFEKRGVAQLG